MKRAVGSYTCGLRLMAKFFHTLLVLVIKQNEGEYQFSCHSGARGDVRATNVLYSAVAPKAIVRTSWADE